MASEYVCCYFCCLVLIDLSRSIYVMSVPYLLVPFFLRDIFTRPYRRRSSRGLYMQSHGSPKNQRRADRSTCKSAEPVDRSIMASAAVCSAKSSCCRMVVRLRSGGWPTCRSCRGRTEIPVINVGELRLGGPDELGKLRRACEGWAFFQVRDMHQPPTETLHQSSILFYLFLRKNRL